MKLGEALSKLKKEKSRFPVVILKKLLILLMILAREFTKNLIS